MNQQQQPQPIPTIYLHEFKNSGASTDGTEAAIMFTDLEGRQIVLRMRMETAGALQRLCSEIRARQARKDTPTTLINRSFPKKVSVADPSDIRGSVLLVIDEMLIDEAVYVLPDQIALGISEQLERHALSHMTEKERRAWIGKRSHLLLPTQPKLIIPGQ